MLKQSEVLFHSNIFLFKNYTQDFLGYFSFQIHDFTITIDAASETSVCIVKV